MITEGGMSAMIDRVFLPSVGGEHFWRVQRSGDIIYMISILGAASLHLIILTKLGLTITIIIPLNLYRLQGLLYSIF